MKVDRISGVGRFTWWRRLLNGVVLAGAGLMLAPAAQAESWPTRPVRVILPFGAGTGTDLAARLIGEELSKQWGRPVQVENHPGGDNLIAINTFLKAHDDHVLLYASTAAFLAHPYTLKRVPYDRAKDIAPIARVTNTVFAVATSKEVEAKTLPALIQLAKQHPGQLNAAATAGMSSFTLSYFFKNEGIDVTGIPYKDAQMVTDLIANRVQMYYGAYAVVNNMYKAGKLNVVAVVGNQRASFAPEVPTTAEAGISSLDIGATAGFYGPDSMPLVLRKRIAADIIAVAKRPDIVERLAATGQVVDAAGPEELEATIQEQSGHAALVAQALNLKDVRLSAAGVR